MGNTFSRPTCKQCGTPRRLQATGRPGDYCSTKCRQAAHRQRQTAAAPPDTEDFDQALRSRLQEITRTAQAILTAIDQPDTPAQELLATMVHLQVTSERLAPDMVARTKLRGASWEQIAAPLGMSKDAARKKWASPRRAQTLQPTRPTRPPVAKPPGNGPTARSAPDGKETGRDSAAPPGTTPATWQPLPSGARGQDLATVLSSLQRASGLSLRALASRSDLSAGFLSRLMTGERFPAWKNVAAIARACGADPSVLRQVWEASAARRDSPPRPTSLATALRFLHQRAGSPTPWAIAITSGNTLDQDHVAAVLAGTTTAPWEDIERLIQVLDGEPSFFLPLWQAETADYTPPPQPPATPEKDHLPAAANRAEELLTAFSSALVPPLRTPSPRLGLATPIPGVRPWAGR
ncbi:helix-turn-helix domain-containing protein [Streptomyces sp. WAC06128]|uniref:helix-turn-helix domain-containing protein n=1 Tax=Streptomyces sp. WAC06128 TaxID=2487426 RepID=UPI00163CBE15|nr:helix-turn-helix transcriptional regulator [Streptomyces sp. WAC06128]